MGGEAILLRGALLNPLGSDDWQFIADGGLFIEDGLIREAGPMRRFRRVPESAVVDSGGLLLPGFIDVHTHWVQHAIRGRFHEDLLDWLARHVWPEEARFADAAHARSQARRFFHDTLRAGTTAGMAWSSAHSGATRIAAEERRGDWVIGPAWMDVPLDNAPAGDNGLARELESTSVAEACAPLLAALGADHFAVTPRFAPACSMELMRALGEVAARHGCFIQTHLAESPAEVRATAARFPAARDYTDVYDQAGLLTPRSVVAHCIHLREAAWQVLAARGCWIAHCPSSNEALGSGRMPLETVRRHGIPWALGSDVGAGPSHSMLHVMQRFLAQHRAAGCAVGPREALHAATRAGAACLRRPRLGGLEAGKQADVVVLPHPGGSDTAGAFEALLQGSPAELETRPLATWLAGRPTGAQAGEASGAA